YRFCHYLISLMFFFFSSRRRHTRWPRDWSSDVCSSDLGRSFPAFGGQLRIMSISNGKLPKLRAPQLEMHKSVARRLCACVALTEIGRASCRERVYIQGVAEI